ncbi:MAG: hypothetical protein ACP5NI_08565, partial [Acetobacteraceae bacterium]
MLASAPAAPPAPVPACASPPLPLGAGFAAWAGTLRAWFGSGAAVLIAAGLAAALVLSRPAGGTGGLLAAILLIGGVTLLGRRPVLAGAMFGLLGALPQFAVLLPAALLGLGAWRSLKAATLTALALAPLSLLASSPVFVPPAFALPILLPGGFAGAGLLQAALSAGLMAATFVSFRRVRAAPGFPLAAGALLAAVPLAAPHAALAGALTVPVAAAMLLRGRRPRHRAALGPLLALLAPALVALAPKWAGLPA